MRQSAAKWLGIALVTVTSAAQGEVSGFFGVEGGYSDIGLEAFDDSIAYRAYGGVNFIDEFGVYGSYGTLGEFDVADSSVDASIEVDNTMQLGLIFNGPFLLSEKGRIHASYGMYRTDITPVNSNGASSESDDSGFVYGLGVSYPVVNQFSATFNWQFYNNIEGENFMTYNLGGRFDF